MRGLPGTTCRRRIYLMRHAAVSYFDVEGRPLDPRNVPLSGEGREQAQAASQMLRSVAFDFAVCSGLPRTVETARAVLAGRDLPLHEDVRLKEVKAGRLKDVPAEQREQVIAYAYDNAAEPDASFIGGERWTAFEQRVLSAWNDLLSLDPWLNLLIVAHDAVNRVLLSHVTGTGLTGLKAFEQDPACINMIEMDIDAGRVMRAFLRAVNIAPYDPTRQDRHLTVMEKVFREFKPD